MKRIGYRLTSWIFPALLGATIGPAVAQLTAPANDQNVLVAGITEGPDPIPQVIWLPADHIYPKIDLAAGRSDDRPDVTLDAAGSPVVTWGYKFGIDHNVALLRWDGSAWAPVEFVTATSSDEIDPRAFVGPSGEIHVVWWVPGAPERVKYTHGRPGLFGYPRTVATGGRRPSVAQWGGLVLVAFERDSGTSRQQIVVASGGVSGSFVPKPVFEVERSEPLDVVLHEARGQLWMDWKISAAQMAYSKNVNGLWTEPVAVPWHNPTWAGSEDARKTIRDLVFAP